jgi:hypothetical protein
MYSLIGAAKVRMFFYSANVFENIFFFSHSPLLTPHSLSFGAANIDVLFYFTSDNA